MLNLAKDIMADTLGQTYLFYIGQAGFILKSARGDLLAVDLYLSDCVSRFDGFKRLTPFILSPEEIALDYIVATHAHYDHFDIDSMPALLANGKTRLFASKCCEIEVRRLEINKDNVTYVETGDEADLGDMRIEFVFCDHGKSAPNAVGVVITIDGKLVYMAGDTCLRLDKAPEIKKERIYDVMIAPINGTFGNLDENEAAILCEKVQPRLFIPSHYGTFAEQYGNVGNFVSVMSNICPRQKYCLMRIGEGIQI